MLAAGERVYAVGDIHGRRDLLARMERRIADDLRRRPPAGASCIVYLGDYVDRGRDSRGVVDDLVRATPAVRRHFLIGNHDLWWRQWLENGMVSPAWLQSGAWATLASYGFETAPAPTDAAGWEALRLRFLRRMPPAHRRFLNELQLSHRQGDYLFVHAGIRPGVALEQQQPHDLMFIREPFLSDTSELGVIVVHGHTVVEAPERRRNRIAVDTGAWRTGRLTAAVLEADRVAFLSTDEDGG